MYREPDCFSLRGYCFASGGVHYTGGSRRVFAAAAAAALHARHPVRHRENFEDVVPEDAILVAVEEIQSDGLFDWASSHRHPDSIDFYEDAVAEDYAQDKFSFEALKEIASESQGAGLGSEEEKATRAAVL